MAQLNTDQKIQGYTDFVLEDSVPPLKIIILGDSGVGKTCFCRVLADENFDLESKSTVGVEFTEFNEIIDNRKLNIQLWDTAGQERYRSIAGAFYRKAIGVIMVYDTTSKRSFSSLQRWQREVNNHAESRMFGLVFGNKCDLKNLKEVSTEEAEQWCNKYGYIHFEGSALKRENVKDTLKALLGEILDYIDFNPALCVKPSIKLADMKQQTGQNPGGMCCVKQILVQLQIFLSVQPPHIPQGEFNPAMENLVRLDFFCQ